MKITEIHPKTLVLEYRQEECDPDYGTCLWARFTLDLDHYTLAIESDCGNYSYGWYATPSESFLHLCGRFQGEQDYLLGKMSEKSVIDDGETIARLREYFSERNVPDPEFMDSIECAVHNALSEDYLIHDLMDLVSMYPGVDADEYDLEYQIVMDYPANARKIMDVFCTHIAPMLAEMEASGA